MPGPKQCPNVFDDSAYICDDSFFTAHCQFFYDGLFFSEKFRVFHKLFSLHCYTYLTVSSIVSNSFLCTRVGYSEFSFCFWIKCEKLSLSFKSPAQCIDLTADTSIEDSDLVIDLTNIRSIMDSPVVVRALFSYLKLSFHLIPILLK